MAGIIKSTSYFFTDIVHRFLPDPLIFAILLTVLFFGMGVGMLND